jgi:hypothetical protein
MIPFPEFRLAPINRDAVLAEKLAGVPEGTFEAFEAQIEDIASEDLHDILPQNRESAIQERFSIMRVDGDVRRYHDFSQNWFGKPTAETVMLLSKWGYVKDGVMQPGAVHDEEKVAALVRTQGIQLPKGVKIRQLGGIEWNERLALQIGRIRDSGR